MTLLELMLAIVGMALIGLATTALLAGAASAWDSRDQFSDQLQSMRTISHQLQQMVYSARRVVNVNVGSRYTDLVLWTDDDQFPNDVNLSELVVLTWDAQLKTLTLYRAALSDGDKLNAVLNPPFVAAAVGASDFGSSFRASSNVQSYLLAERITGFDVTLTNGSQTGASYHTLFVKMTTQSAVAAPSQAVTICATARAPDTAVDFAQGGGG